MRFWIRRRATGHNATRDLERRQLCHHHQLERRPRTGIYSFEYLRAIGERDAAKVVEHV